ncbi:putative bifunctional diguanylate cyclase/phosphodiesterase [Glaciecola siphonariae]|uniref:Bifunctional diguanylate cyclase/phosphodiesterase n=1 Tax=Glaciecola siphonariae TaxID=521012 RepID=A0ABV9LVI4_9ALTE
MSDNKESKASQNQTVYLFDDRESSREERENEHQDPCDVATPTTNTPASNTPISQTTAPSPQKTMQDNLNQNSVSHDHRAEQSLFETAGDDDYAIYQSDVPDDHRMMEFALWGSGLSVWSWYRESDEIEIKAFQNGQYRRQSVYPSFSAFWECVHADDVNELKRKWAAILDESLIVFDYQFRFLFKDEYRWLQLKGRVTALDDVGVNTLVGTFQDISEQKSNETQSNIMSYALAQTSQPMLILEKNLTIVDVNTAFFNQIDPSFAPLNNTSFASSVAIAKGDIESLEQHGFLQVQTEYFRANSNGSVKQAIPVELAFNLFHMNELNQDYYIVALTNLTSRLQNEATLHRLAHYDSLTGLLNRRALQESLTELTDAQRPFALCYIDLEGFKQINEAFGHEFGDSVLENIGASMQQSLTKAAQLCRWGGDELIATFYETDEETLSKYVQDIVDIVASQKIVMNGQRFTLRAHIGVACFPDNALGSSELIRNADAALFYAKSEEDCTYKMYTQGMTDDKVKRITFVNDLREALNAKELSFVLQGKFNQERELIGAEVLCRWHSPKHGHVSPGVFVPLIEKHGMEYQLGELALENAMSFIYLLEKQGIRIPISVNISSSQFLQASFVELVKSLVGKHQIDPRLIELEITESVFMVDEQLATQNFDRVRALGFRISLDDFGTGYSSLSYLSKYHFDVVKIDRQFIIDLADNAKAQKLFLAILNLCKALDIETVVEGIETEQQFEMLTESGVTKFQGFLLGMPTAFKDFALTHQGNRIH